MPLFIPQLRIGIDVQAWDADLDAIAAIASTGLLARTGSGSAAARTITGTTNQVNVSNGNGVSGNPTLSLPQSIDTSAGVTFGSLTLSTPLSAANGGTGLSSVGSAGQIIRSDGSAFALSTATRLNTLTANQLLYAPSTNVEGGSANLTFDGSTQTLGGNLTFSGNARRITGDFSSATHANKTAFQTSSANSSTNVSAIPSGTGTASAYDAWSSSDPDNASRGQLFASSSFGAVGFQSAKTGTGTLLPLDLLVGSTRLRVATTGGIFIGGNTAATAVLHLAAGTATASTGQIKLEPSTLLSVVESGVIERVTDKLHFTIGTGPARKELTLNDIALTSGRLPQITTNGRITDSSGLTVASNVITAAGYEQSVATDALIFPLSLRNTSTGTSAGTRLRIGNSGSANAFTIDVFGGSHATKANYAEIINQFNAPLILGSNGAEDIRINNGVVTLPTLGTTASAANAFIDNAASNSLLRSTSSLAFKRVIGDLSLDDARNIVLNSKPIRYVSKARADNPFREFIGFGAEQIARVDDRFITRRADSSPDWVQYQAYVAPLCLVAADHDARLARLEHAAAAKH